MSVVVNYEVDDSENRVNHQKDVENPSYTAGSSQPTRSSKWHHLLGRSQTLRTSDFLKSGIDKKMPISFECLKTYKIWTHVFSFEHGKQDHLLIGSGIQKHILQVGNYIMFIPYSLSDDLQGITKHPKVVVARFFIFIPTWGRFPFWVICFRWVETTN